MVTHRRAARSLSTLTLVACLWREQLELRIDLGTTCHLWHAQFHFTAAGCCMYAYLPSRSEVLGVKYGLYLPLIQRGHS